MREILGSEGWKDEKNDKQDIVMQVKEVIFFTYGDSSKASTWSNVPFLFTKTLEGKGIKVDRIDLTQTPMYQRLTWGGVRQGAY